MLLVPNLIPLTAGSVSAPVTAMSTSPPRTLAAKPPKVTSTVARSSGLTTSRLASLCARRSAAPDRLTPRWASPGRPRSWTTANGPVRRISRIGTAISSTRHWSDGPELNPHALRQQRRVRPLQIPQHGIGATDELPTAGGLTRIDRAELTGETDGAGGHRGPRLCAARHPQAGVAIDQIRETWCESTESDPPQRGGVGVDHGRDRQPGVIGHLGQVRTVVDDIDDHVGAAFRGGARGGIDAHLAQPPTDDALTARAVQLHQHRAGGRDDVDHARDRRGAQRVSPRQYLSGTAALHHQRSVAVVHNGVADQLRRQVVGKVAAKVRHAHYSTVTPGSGLVRGLPTEFRALPELP